MTDEAEIKENFWKALKSDMTMFLGWPTARMVMPVEAIRPAG